MISEVSAPGAWYNHRQIDDVLLTGRACLLSLPCHCHILDALLRSACVWIKSSQTLLLDSFVLMFQRPKFLSMCFCTGNAAFAVGVSDERKRVKHLLLGLSFLAECWGPLLGDAAFAVCVVDAAFVVACGVNVVACGVQECWGPDVPYMFHVKSFHGLMINNFSSTCLE